MISKIKATILSISALFMMALPMAVAVPAYADTNQNDINNGLKCGSNLNLENIGSNPGKCNTTTGGKNLTDIVRTVINLLSVLVGAIAVIMIIIGGFRYVTSGGNDSSVSAAKNTILYALVGLVIVALAQIIVHFILNNIAA